MRFCRAVDHGDHVVTVGETARCWYSRWPNCRNGPGQGRARKVQKDGGPVGCDLHHPCRGCAGGETGDRTRHEPDLTAWLGKRAGAGYAAPRGFPRQQVQLNGTDEPQDDQGRQSAAGFIPQTLALGRLDHRFFQLPVDADTSCDLFFPRIRQLPEARSTTKVKAANTAAIFVMSSLLLSWLIHVGRAKDGMTGPRSRRCRHRTSPTAVSSRWHGVVIRSMPANGT